MKKSTDAAKSAADSAKGSVDQATSATHLEQRAWVSLDSIVGIPESGKELRVTVTWKNTGKTFAKKAHLMVKVESTGKDEATPDYDIEKFTVFDPPHIGVVAPNSSSKMVTGVKEHHVMTEDEMNRIRSGELIYYVRGKAIYNDIFGCNHWTTFCYRLNPGTWEYDDCEIGNEADDNACP